ncbi:MAG: hypothetical protein OXU45_05410 [Candidatus Melainabacteria bacterium]|nr:hypothetical protein [Candidatus Melainabacteria bacterium]
MRALSLIICISLSIFQAAWAFPQTVFPRITSPAATQKKVDKFIKTEYVEKLAERKTYHGHKMDFSRESDVLAMVRYVAETANYAINRSIDYFPEDHYSQAAAYQEIRDKSQADFIKVTKNYGGTLENWGYAFNPELESYLIGEFKQSWNIKGDPHKPYFEAIKKELALKELKLFFRLIEVKEMYPRYDHPISNFLSLKTPKKFLVFFTDEPNWGLGGYTMDTRIYINMGRLQKITHLFNANLEETVQMVISNEIAHAMINHVFGDDRINDSNRPDRNIFRAKKLNGYTIHDNREAVEFISDAISMAVNPKFIILPLASGEDGYRLSRRFAREELTKYCLSHDIPPPQYSKLDNELKLRAYLEPKLNAKGLSYKDFQKHFQSQYTLMADNIFAEFGFTLQPVI